MNSPLLALFVRSLREDARGRATYWTRGGLGCFLLLILFSFAAGNNWTNAPGREFFTGIIVFQMVAVTFVGLSYFASAVAEEKEEQTLGLLRMTGLSPLSILLGKSTSRLCGALLLLAGQFPFTIFAVTLGGVSLRQIVAAYCTFGAFIFLLCNVALLGSVFARRTAGAAAFCVVVIALLLGLGPLLWTVPAVWRDFLGIGPALDRVADVLWRATPVARLMEVLGTGYSGAAAGWQVASNLALGIGCFLLAWAAFERFCDRAPDGAASSAPSQRRFFGLRLSRPPRPWKNALLWKDFYYLCGGHAAFALRTLAYGCAAIPFFLPKGTWTTFGVFTGIFSTVAPFIFSIDAAIMAARIFRTELRDQTWSALAMLPFTIRQIAHRKMFACVLAAAPGVVGTFAVQIVGFNRFVFATRGLSGMVPMAPMLFAKVLSAWVMTLLIVHVVAWLSLLMKRGALPLGFVLTYAVYFLFSVLFATVIAARRFAAYAASSRAGVSRSSISFIYWSPITFAIISIIVIAVLHYRSLRRLELLAGES
jgi:hypothetical protein